MANLNKQCRNLPLGFFEGWVCSVWKGWKYITIWSLLIVLNQIYLIFTASYMLLNPDPHPHWHWIESSLLMEKNTYYQKSKKDSGSRIRIKLLLSSRKYDPKYSSRIRILILYPSRMQGSTMLLIPDPDPQHWKSTFKTLKTQRWHIFYFDP